ncbi:MAG: sulfatase-like hydrolase/transferase, partial [Phycisphaerales bacterium]|nr:sulfatase-like hydrolase/transferase [Phycisphaerales bacterium]
MRTRIAILVMFVASFASRANASDAPNIVFILADDLGWKDVGFMGSTYYRTPHLDRLASESLVFTDAYSAGPNCSPTRASLLTGAWTPRHRLYSPGRSDKAPRRLMTLRTPPIPTTLDPEWVTLAEALHTHVGAAMGKWHMGDDPDRGPLAQGFEVNVGGTRAGHPPAGYFAPFRLPNLEDAPEGSYLTERLTDEAIAFLETPRDRPFFLYLAHYAVHTPLPAPEAMVNAYRDVPGADGQDNPTYAAMVESLDTSVGRVLEALERLGLADDTIVIFSSDNGG